MGSKLRGDGVEFPDGTVQTTATRLSETVIFYKSGTFVKPADVKYFEVILVGGGGGGGHTDISTALPDTNGGRSIFFPTSDLPYHEEGMHIAEGGEGAKSSATGGTETHSNLISGAAQACGGEAGYLGEPGSVYYQFNAPNYIYGYKSGETTLQPYIDPDGNVFLNTVVYNNYYTGGGQGGKCHINNIKGGVGEVFPKYESPTGTGRYTAQNKNSSSAQSVSWSGGGGATAYYLYTNNISNDPNDLYTDGEYWHHWRGGDGGQGTISNASEYTPAGYKLEKSLAGLGHGWQLVSNSGSESFELAPESSRYAYYNASGGFYLRGGMGFLGGGGASLSAPFSLPHTGLTAYNGGGGGGPGAGGGAPGGGKGGSAGEVKSFSISTDSPEKSYTVVIGKGGNGGWSQQTGNSWNLMAGGGGGAQGICIIRY